jgi:hypothetical protein
LGIILSTYKWTQFAIVSDDFLLNIYLGSAIEFYVQNGLLGGAVLIRTEHVTQAT